MTQLALFPRRVTLRTTRQTRDLSEIPETVTGSVVATWPTMALVRFDGAWSLGSSQGCTLLVDLDELEAA